jgi:hypothetical protein
MPVDCSGAQCTFTWDDATQKWEQQTSCGIVGCDCADKPVDPTVGTDPSFSDTGPVGGAIGDIWISPCAPPKGGGKP